MKIQLKGYKVDENICYKIVNKEQCCENISKCPVLGISYYDDDGEYTYPKISLKEIVEQPYDEYCTETNYYPINLCPYCGSKLSIEVLEIEDMTNQYYETKKKADEFYQKAIRCDSKSAEAKNRQMGRELSNSLNWLLTSDQI